MNELPAVIPRSLPTTSSWDANGNLALENTGGAWDSENRLLQVDSGADSEVYVYAAYGLRRKKIVGGVTTHFI